MDQLPPLPSELSEDQKDQVVRIEVVRFPTIGNDPTTSWDLNLYAADSAVPIATAPISFEGDFYSAGLNAIAKVLDPADLAYLQPWSEQDDGARWLAKAGRIAYWTRPRKDE
jgi:hypothetical protein